MRLAKLTLNGFKSFADRTELRFDDPITAIVGPNGCGKSNVVDAIKWVLGERSAKSLRGEQMMDVIFGGSSKRKPMDFAEVILSFENPIADTATGRRELPLGTEIVDVGRRLFRSGKSEYLINDRKCRLKDVRDLFMDTGAGRDAYAIIEQGRVDAMLTSNPVDRRTIFEEAAGVAKFKARKIEAARKLEKAEVNLVRVRDEQQVESEFGGTWTLRIYTDETQGAEHIVLVKGDISGPEPVLVRMHAMDPLLDVVGTGPKGRAGEFGDAMKLIAAEGRGVLVLLRDLTMKLSPGDEVSPQTLRQYGLGAQILSSLGISDMILLTNSPKPRVVGLDAYGLSIVGTRKISELG